MPNVRPSPSTTSTTHALDNSGRGVAGDRSPQIDEANKPRRQRIDWLPAGNDDQSRRARRPDPGAAPATERRSWAAVPGRPAAQRSVTASAPASPSPVSPLPALRRMALTPSASPLAATPSHDGAREVYPKWKGPDRMIVSSNSDSTAKRSARAQRNYRKVPDSNFLDLGALAASQPNDGDREAGPLARMKLSGRLDLH